MTLDLVEFEVAKAHLRITDDDHDEEIQRKLDQAEEEIYTYLNSTGCWNDEWVDPDTTSLVVQAAVLKLLGGRYEHRGDDSSTADNHEMALWDELHRTLGALKKPALA